MIWSMTGFGSSTVETEAGSVRAEARSVNSRHLRVSFRLPERAQPWEADLRAMVSDRVSRGQVDIRVSVDAPEVETGPIWELDEARVRGYLEAFRVLREEYTLPGQVDLPLLLRAGEILREVRPEALEWLEAGQLRRAVEEALAGMVEMRQREGQRLAEDLRARAEAIWNGVDEVERLAPERLRKERERLREAVAELTGGADRDDDRLEREIVFLADKWDIGEEVVRTRAHLEAFAEYLAAPASEAVGKRLAFLVQELHREINTMGAKANDARISRHVVEMKNELEKMREQVENVE